MILFSNLDIYANISGKITSALVDIFLTEANGNIIKVSNFPVNMPFQYLLCQNLDLNDYFDLKLHTPVQVQFRFESNDGVGISLNVEDINRKASRNLRTSRLAYSGALMQNFNLSEPLKFQYFLKLSQTINLESNTKLPCRNYPNKDFLSFDFCDGDFVYNQVKRNFNVTPFWATRDLSKVTRESTLDYAPMDLMKYPMGEIESSCLKPCVSTQV